jgi:hypothetical protein
VRLVSPAIVRLSSPRTNRNQKGRFDTIVTGTSVHQRALRCHSQARSLCPTLRSSSFRGRAVRLTSHDSIESGAFCFASVFSPPVPGPRSRSPVAGLGSRRPQPGPASRQDLGGESTRPFSELKRPCRALRDQVREQSFYFELCPWTNRVAICVLAWLKPSLVATISIGPGWSCERMIKRARPLKAFR